MTTKSIGARLREPGGVAERLRAIRVDAELSGKGLAAAAGWAGSKVSRIELGQQAPTAPDIEVWVRVCHGEPDEALNLISMLRAIHAEHASWNRRFRNGQTAVQRAYNRMFAEARLIRDFQTMAVSGLLQTAPYARRILSEARLLNDLSLDDVEEAVAARIQRQQLLYDNQKSFEFLLAESVLYWQLCPAAEMAAQLDRLHTVIGLPNVRFGVFPFAAGQAALPENSFEVVDDLAIVDTFAGETTYRGENVHKYSAILDRPWRHAVSGESARRLIAAAAERLV